MVSVKKPSGRGGSRVTTSTGDIFDIYVYVVFILMCLSFLLIFFKIVLCVLCCFLFFIIFGITLFLYLVLQLIFFSFFEGKNCDYFHSNILFIDR